MDRIERIKLGYKVTDFTGFSGPVLIIDHVVFFRNFILHRHWGMLKYCDFVRHPTGSYRIVDLDRPSIVIPEHIEFGGKEIEMLRISGMQFVEHAYKYNLLMCEYKLNGLGN